MKEKKLILQPFEKALVSLEEVLQLKTNPVIRDSAIQRFEYTYELAFKMLLRFLEALSPNVQEVDHYSFKEAIRVGAEKGLIDDVKAWFEYRKARNLTSHGYDESKANEVFALLPAFTCDARHLFEKLKELSIRL